MMKRYKVWSNDVWSDGSPSYTLELDEESSDV